MKKIERKSRVLKLHREIVVHLSNENLQQAVGGSGNTACWGCHGGSTSERQSTEQDNDSTKKL